MNGKINFVNLEKMYILYKGGLMEKIILELYDRQTGNKVSEIDVTHNTTDEIVEFMRLQVEIGREGKIKRKGEK
jgi:hypothetical protein